MTSSAKKDIFLFDMEILDKKPTELVWEATKKECTEMGERLDLKSIKNFICKFKLFRLPHSEQIDVNGNIEAEITQICCVSLAPFDTKIIEDFTASFEIATQKTKKPSQKQKNEDSADKNKNDNKWHTPEVAEMLFGNVIAGTDDRPEILKSNMLDLRDLATQYFSLELSDYPRTLNAELNEDFTSAGTEKASPFAVLEGLLDKNKDKD